MGGTKHAANLTKEVCQPGKQNDQIVLHDHEDHYAVCEPHSWVDFKFVIEDAKLNNSNMVFEVKDLMERDDPQAISLHVWPGAIDYETRESDAKLTSTTAAGRVYSVSQNHIDLKFNGVSCSERYLTSGEKALICFGENTYYAGVQCGTEKTRFSIMALLVKAEVHAGAHEAGEVCPNEWSYHFYLPAAHTWEITNETLVLPTITADAHRHRSRRLGSSREMVRIPEERRLARKKSSGSSSSSSSGGAARAGSDDEGGEVGGYGDAYNHGYHLKFELEVFSGDIRMLAIQPQYPPGFTSGSSNVYSKLFNSQSQKSRSQYDVLHVKASACNIGNGTHYAADRFYLGVFGGTKCSDYSLIVTEYEGECEQESIFAVGTKSAFNSSTH